MSRQIALKYFTKALICPKNIETIVIRRQFSWPLDKHYMAFCEKNTIIPEYVYVSRDLDKVNIVAQDIIKDPQFKGSIEWQNYNSGMGDILGESMVWGGITMVLGTGIVLAIDEVRTNLKKMI